MELLKRLRNGIMVHIKQNGNNNKNSRSRRFSVIVARQIMQTGVSRTVNSEGIRLKSKFCRNSHFVDRKARTPNKRFGVMRGVCSQKVLREFESLSPVRALVFPHPNAKPPTVGRQRTTSKKDIKQILKSYVVTLII